MDGAAGRSRTPRPDDGLPTHTLMQVQADPAHADRGELAQVVDPDMGSLPDRIRMADWGLLRRFQFGVRWIRAHPWIFGAIVLNAVFLFLPFYDSNNLPWALAVTSHFNSAVPPSSYNHWVAGFFIYAAYVPLHLAYVGSGYQIYWAFTTLKVLYFGLTLWMAYAFYRVFQARSQSLAEAVAVFVLANPLWLFVNYIWTEFDIIPVAFVAVGYLVLRYGDIRLSEHFRTLVGVALIAVSVFFYWYALVLIPTLLYYSTSNRERARMLAYGGAVVGGMFALTVLVFSASPTAYLAALTGGNSLLNRADFFGFQYFVSLTSTEYLGLAGAIVVGLPWLLRRLRFSEAASAFVVLTLFVFTNSVPTPDNYVFVFPFALFSFLNWREADARLRWLWPLLAYPLVGLALSNLFIANAQPDGVGVFYWGYDLFRSNPQFLVGPTMTAEFLRAFNLAVVAAITLSIGVLTLFDRRRPMTPPAVVPSSERARPSPAPPLRLPRRRVIVAASTFAAVAALALAFNVAAPDLVTYTGVGNAPIYLMTPFYVPSTNNVVRPIPGQTFSQSGATIDIPAPAPPLVFGRWFSTESVELAGHVGFSGVVPRATLAIDSAPFPVSILNRTLPQLDEGNLTPPSSEFGVHAVHPGALPFNPGVPVYYLDGNSSQYYSFDGSGWIGGTYTLAVDPVRWSPGQTAVLYLRGAGEALALASDANRTRIVYSGAGPSGSIELFGGLPLNVWSFVSFRPTPEGVAFDVNGVDATVTAPLFTSGVSTLMTVGKPPYLNAANNTYYGFSSGLYSSGGPLPMDSSFGFSVATSHGTVNGTLGAPALDFNLTSSPGATHLAITGGSFDSGLQTTIFAIGKWFDGPYAVTLTLGRFVMRQVAPDRFYLVPVFWAAAAPLLLVGVSLAVLPADRERSGTPRTNRGLLPEHGPPGG
ncbi:MAG TPA: hypothetical protein VGV89_00485 [Thermoplasmata archaeon]|nr:hypothetical protein [Thermoplasmata archaeon]